MNIKSFLYIKKLLDLELTLSSIFNYQKFCLIINSEVIKKLDISPDTLRYYEIFIC